MALSVRPDRVVLLGIDLQDVLHLLLLLDDLLLLGLAHRQELILLICDCLSGWLLLLSPHLRFEFKCILLYFVVLVDIRQTVVRSILVLVALETTFRRWLDELSSILLVHLVVVLLALEIHQDACPGVILIVVREVVVESLMSIVPTGEELLIVATTALGLGTEDVTADSTAVETDSSELVVTMRARVGDLSRDYESWVLIIKFGSAIVLNIN